MICLNYLNRLGGGRRRFGSFLNKKGWMRSNCALSLRVHLNGISSVQESKPTHLADASSDQEPAYGRGGMTQ